jgi:hypothetical protein
MSRLIEAVKAPVAFVSSHILDVWLLFCLRRCLHLTLTTLSAFFLANMLQLLIEQHLVGVLSNTVMWLLLTNESGSCQPYSHEGLARLS